jgi:hypothetical protein
MKAALVTTMAAVLLAACAGGGSSAPKISEDSKYIPQIAVGDENPFQFTITNGSQAINDLRLCCFGDWLKHNVVTSVDPSACSRDGDEIKCGALAANATLVIDLDGVAKDSGNFSYGISVFDGTGDVNQQDGKSAGWTFDQAVTP